MSDLKDMILDDENAYLKMPVGILILAIIFLLWNVMGVYVFLHDVTLSPEGIAELAPEMQPFYQNVPLWNWLAYGLAVFAGLIGSILMIAKKSLALPAFIASLIGILVQNFYSFFVSDAMNELELGAGMYIMPALVIGIGIVEVMVSRKSIREGWLS